MLIISRAFSYFGCELKRFMSFFPEHPFSLWNRIKAVQTGAGESIVKRVWGQVAPIITSNDFSKAQKQNRNYHTPLFCSIEKTRVLPAQDYPNISTRYSIMPVRSVRTTATGATFFMTSPSIPSWSMTAAALRILAMATPDAIPPLTAWAA